jgi:hypothetical protein
MSSHLIKSMSSRERPEVIERLPRDPSRQG